MTLDITTLLVALDRGNTNVYNDACNSGNKIDIDKNISWLIPQWMVSSYNTDQHINLILNFENACNSGWQKFYHHPELQAKLLSVISGGNTTRHRFYPPSKKSKIKNAELYNMLLVKYENIDEREMMLFCRDTTDEEVISLMNYAGIDIKSRKKIWTQLNTIRELN